MQEILKQIISYGVHAPSGDNSQPWRFELEADAIKIYKVLDRENDIYNFEERGTMIAHGALLYTMEVAAKALGYTLTTVLFPNGDEGKLVAVCRVSVSDEKKDEKMLECIKRRATNRHPYTMKSLDTNKKKIYEEISEMYPHVGVSYVYDTQVRETIAHAVSVNEKVLLTYKPLHDIFFKDVRWSDKEEKKVRTGLHIDTLELALPQKKVFTMLRNWKFATIASKLGLPKVVAKDNADRYKTGAAIGCITVTNTSREAFIEAGKCMQQIWLIATRQDVSFQPITAIVYLAEQVKKGKIMFPQELKTDILSAITTIQSSFDIESKDTIALIFRFGYANYAPSAITSRREPVIS